MQEHNTYRRGLVVEYAHCRETGQTRRAGEVRDELERIGALGDIEDAVDSTPLERAVPKRPAGRRKDQE